MNIENRKIYNWNLAYNLVMQVKDTFMKEVNQGEDVSNYNFETWLVSLNNDYFNKVFSFLDVTQYGTMVLLKYKGYQYIFKDGVDNTNFWNMYDGLFRYCRSIVIDLQNEDIVLLPQSKFHNLNEIDGWMLEDVEDKISKAKEVEVTNKLDGSNQNARYYNGKIIMSGSQALDPNNSWRLADGYAMLTDNHVRMMKEFPNYTFMFEFISQKDAHVVCYSKEQEGLYLFGMRNVLTGIEVSYENVVLIAQYNGVKTTEIYKKTLEEIIDESKKYTSDEKEGWVINIIFDDDTNFKVKLKTEDYVHMHKILSKLTSPNLVVENIAENRFDDFFSKVPITHRDKINKYAEIVYNYVNSMEANTRRYYHIAPKEDKKEFMIWVDTVVPKQYRGYVRSIYLGKEYSFLKKGAVKVPSYKSFNEILKEEKISVEEILEDDE